MGTISASPDAHAVAALLDWEAALVGPRGLDLGYWLMMDRFHAVMDNWLRIMTRQKRLTFLTAGYDISWRLGSGRRLSLGIDGQISGEALPETPIVAYSAKFVGVTENPPGSNTVEWGRLF